MSASDQSYNKPFLGNEFKIIFEDKDDAYLWLNEVLNTKAQVEEHNCLLENNLS